MGKKHNNLLYRSVVWIFLWFPNLFLFGKSGLHPKKICCLLLVSCIPSRLSQFYIYIYGSYYHPIPLEICSAFSLLPLIFIHVNLDFLSSPCTRSSSIIAMANLLLMITLALALPIGFELCGLLLLAQIFVWTGFYSFLWPQFNVISWL